MGSDTLWRRAYVVGTWGSVRCTACDTWAVDLEEGPLGDERERAVLEYADLDGRDPAGVRALGGSVERLAELHDVDPVLAQRRAHRGRRVGLAGRDLQLDDLDDLFRHTSPLVWCKRPVGAPTVSFS